MCDVCVRFVSCECCVFVCVKMVVCVFGVIVLFIHVFLFLGCVW